MKKAVSLLVALGMVFALDQGCQASASAADKADSVVVAPQPPKPTKNDKLLINHGPKVSKTPPPTTGIRPLLGTPYFYAGAAQDTSGIVSPAVTTVGANFSGPTGTYLDTTHDAHGLVELAVRLTPNSNAGLIEAGITQDPVVNADSQPRLFVAYWDGSGVCGCYNTNFNLYGARTYSPGDVITTTKSIQWIYDGSTNLWWLAVAGTFVGNFNESTLWPSITFNHAGQVLGFGEVAQKASGTRTYSCTDMGNGLDSSVAGPPAAASIGSVSYNSSGTNVNMVALGAYYGYTTTMLSARTYRYGGAGSDSSGNLPGNTGSC